MRCIALTDAYVESKFSKEEAKFLKERAYHFKVSKEKLGVKLKDGVIATYSAGSSKHEYSVGCAKEEIFKVFGI